VRFGYSDSLPPDCSDGSRVSGVGSSLNPASLPFRLKALALGDLGLASRRLGKPDRLVERPVDHLLALIEISSG